MTDNRPHRRIGNGGQGSFIFLHFGQHFMAERNRYVWHFGGDHFADPAFMRAIGISVHQRYGDRLHALAFQRANRLCYAGFIQWADFFAIGADALLHGHRIFQRRQRLRLGPDDPCCETTGHEAARDLHDMAIAIGCDQADPCAFALEHRVGGDGRPVEKIINVAGLDIGIGTNGRDAV